MRYRTGMTAGVVLALLLTGCQSGFGRRVATTEPPLITSPDGSSTVVRADPVRTVTAVDRHPILAAPRDFWNNTNSNKVVKAATATVIGVPVGLIGEARQIVVGVPPELRNQ